MPELDRNQILKEMGITRWVLRDDPAEAVVSSNVDDGRDAQDASLESVASPRVRADPQPQSQSPQKPDPARLQKPVSDFTTLEALDQEVSNCTRCQLAQSRTQTVFGSGPEQADWMFIGEAPGQQEDRQGKPFVGRAGQLLTQMVAALDTTREQVYIANTLKCRPPENRDPLPEELQACEAYLLGQIALVKPKVLVALGRISAQALLKSDQPLGRLRGEVYQYGPAKLPLIVTYHPAYLLRKPADKSKVWTDLLLAHQQLSG